MLALSATPGTDIQAVRAMLQNLKISRIELRNEESPDIVKYTHQRKIEKVVVGLGEELKCIKEKYLAVLEHFVKRLSQSGVLGKGVTYLDVRSLDSCHYLPVTIYVDKTSRGVSSYRNGHPVR